MYPSQKLTFTGSRGITRLVFYNILTQRSQDVKTIFPSEPEATKPKGLPAVLTKKEVHAVLRHLSGTHLLMAQLLYGSGLRPMECLRLRVKDLDLAYLTITVRDGKGEKDRIILPQSLVEPPETPAPGQALARARPGAGLKRIFHPQFPHPPRRRTTLRNREPTAALASCCQINLLSSALNRDLINQQTGVGLTMT